MPREGGSKEPSHRWNWGFQMRTPAGDVMKTRSEEVAIALTRLKSPRTVRSSGRQSRVNDCANVGDDNVAASDSARRDRIGRIYTGRSAADARSTQSAAGTAR